MITSLKIFNESSVNDTTIEKVYHDWVEMTICPIFVMVYLFRRDIEKDKKTQYLIEVNHHSCVRHTKQDRHASYVSKFVRDEIMQILEKISTPYNDKEEEDKRVINENMISIISETLDLPEYEREKGSRSFHLGRKFERSEDFIAWSKRLENIKNTEMGMLI